MRKTAFITALLTLFGAFSVSAQAPNTRLINHVDTPVAVTYSVWVYLSS